TAARLPLFIPAISDDGRYVAFKSSSTNITSPAPSAGENIYLYDRTTTNVTRITKASLALATNATAPTISANGRSAAFTALANSDISGLINVNVTNGLDAEVYD